MTREKDNGVETLHTQNFYKAIDEFFACTTNSSDFQDVNNDMLNVFMEKAMGEEEAFTHKHIKKVVFMTTYQNTFLCKLKETWDLYKKFGNPEIIE